MLKSLHKTAWTIGIGLLLTGIFSGTAYYVESRELQALSANSAEDQLDKAAFALSAARTETYAAGALAGIAIVNNTNPMLKDILPKIQFRQGDEPVWLWARVMPSGDIGSLESAIRREDGFGSFTVRNHPAAAKFAAPIVFAAGLSADQALGFDLMSLTSFSDELALAIGSRLDQNGIADFLAQDGEGTLGQATLYVGALVNGQASSSSPSTRDLFVKGLTYADLVQSLRISPDQAFELSKVLPQGSVEPIFRTAAPVADAVSRTRDLTVGSHVLRLSIFQASSYGHPRNWVIVAIFGLLSTGLISIGRAWIDIGGRAKSLSTALSHTADELTDVRFKEAAFFENSGAANCETDFASGRLLRVNDAMCKLLGYPREEITQMTFQALTHPDDLKESLQNLVDSADQPRDHMQFEKRYIRKDGSPIWCLVNGQLVRDRRGRPAFYTTVVIDISERKQAEANQAMLLAELAHRVRNTVQLTASLARQTAHSARSVQQYDHLFHSRLQALKTAQDLLFDSGWKFARLPDLAERALRPFNPPKGETETFVIDLPDLELPTQHAQTIAIALNELAVNAAKHGALANGGRIHLKGNIDTSGEGYKVLHLKWEESGLKKVRTPRRKGFGTKMLEFAVPEQFQGSAKLTWSPSGMIYEAHLPLQYSALP